MSLNNIIDVLVYTTDTDSSEYNSLINLTKNLDIRGSLKYEINGLKYILSKHKNICIYMPSNPTYKTDFMIEWSCIGKTYRKRSLYINPLIINNLQSCLSNPNIRYGAVLMSINYKDGCKKRGKDSSHANVLIYDKVTNTIERFDPIGGYRSKYNNNQLDNRLERYFSKYNINYLKPDLFCPFNSFQRIQGKEKQFRHGLCASWTIWYIDLKLSNPLIQDSSQLIQLALDKLKNTKSLTNFLLEYIGNAIISQV